MGLLKYEDNLEFTGAEEAQQRWFSANKKVKSSRLESLDLARGLAVMLMILSHGIVGLVPFETLTGWQLVPVHLITKFSSTLFFTVFGFTLGLYFLPQSTEPNFSAKRKRLLIRGLEILVWYKILTFIQMFQTYDRETILNTLLYKKFPDFAEVLGFYALFLLWFPFVMPYWQRLNTLIQVIVVGVLALGGTWLTHNFDFWGYASLKAILVEQKGYYTFGQMQRGALVLFGTILARQYAATPKPYIETFPLKLAMFGFLSMGAFIFISHDNALKGLITVASNGGKHPPNLQFMSFSLGGALVLLAISMFFNERVPALLKPIVWIGQKALQAFVFHIFIIFVVYRYLLDLRHKVPYQTALSLTLLLIVMTSLWCAGLKIKDKR